MFLSLKSIITITIIFALEHSYGLRLHKLFQLLDGYTKEHKLQGYLHIGNDYAIFLRVPKPHDRELVYELYEAKNVDDIERHKPRLLAISKVPVEYIKDQLKTYRIELYKAKYEDQNVVPGTQVKTLREWQIDRALSINEKEGLVIDDKPNFLRTLVQ